MDLITHSLPQDDLANLSELVIMEALTMQASNFSLITHPFERNLLEHNSLLVIDQLIGQAALESSKALSHYMPRSLEMLGQRTLVQQLLLLISKLYTDDRFSLVPIEVQVNFNHKVTSVILRRYQFWLLAKMPIYSLKHFLQRELTFTNAQINKTQTSGTGFGLTSVPFFRLVCEARSAYEQFDLAFPEHWQNVPFLLQHQGCMNTWNFFIAVKAQRFDKITNLSALLKDPRIIETALNLDAHTSLILIIVKTFGLEPIPKAWWSPACFINFSRTHPIALRLRNSTKWGEYIPTDILLQPSVFNAFLSLGYSHHQLLAKIM